MPTGIVYHSSLIFCLTVLDRSKLLFGEINSLLVLFWVIFGRVQSKLRAVVFFLFSKAALIRIFVCVWARWVGETPLHE